MAQDAGAGPVPPMQCSVHACTSMSHTPAWLASGLCQDWECQAQPYPWSHDRSAPGPAHFPLMALHDTMSPDGSSAAWGCRALPHRLPDEVWVHELGADGPQDFIASVFHQGQLPGIEDHADLGARGQAAAEKGAVLGTRTSTRQMGWKGLPCTWAGSHHAVMDPTVLKELCWGHVSAG